MECNTILNAFLKILERHAPLQKKYLKKTASYATEELKKANKKFPLINFCKLKQRPQITK